MSQTMTLGWHGSDPDEALASVLAAIETRERVRAVFEAYQDVLLVAQLSRALTAAFIDKALRSSEGIAGLSAAMRGLIAARTAVMAAVAAIDVLPPAP